MSHRNLIANVEQAIFMRDLDMPYTPDKRPQERWNAFLPLYHAYGQLYTCIMAPKLDVKVYVMKKFEYAAFLRVIERYQITHLQVAPPILVMLGRRPETAAPPTAQPSGPSGRRVAAAGPGPRATRRPCRLR